MYQSKGGDFRTKESLFGMFMHSCLGKLVVLAVVLLLLSFVAYITCPSEKRMKEEMVDNVYQCVMDGDTHVDWIDDTVANISRTFSSADSIPDKETLNVLKKYNRLEIFNHGIYTTAYVFNNFHVEGSRCGIGLFGLVIPVLSIHDLLLQVDPVRRDYNYRPIQADFDDNDNEEMNGSDYLEDDAMLGDFAY